MVVVATGERLDGCLGVGPAGWRGLGQEPRHKHGLLPFLGNQQKEKNTNSNHAHPSPSTTTTSYNAPTPCSARTQRRSAGRRGTARWQGRRSCIRSTRCASRGRPRSWRSPGRPSTRPSSVAERPSSSPSVSASGRSATPCHAVALHPVVATLHRNLPLLNLWLHQA